MATRNHSKLPARRSRATTDLAQYDPDKGLKSIAVAEAAEKHYARAKDATKLYAAIEAKLVAQAAFVAWWDAQEKDKGGGDPRSTHNRPVKGARLGKDGLPDPMVVSRWRQKLADDHFDTELDKVRQRCLQMLEMQGGAHVGYNSGENEWYTPGDYIEAARLVLGDIDLDPASSHAANAIVKAAQIFTLEENGLNHPWHGRVWMNPPYAQPAVEQFCAKFASHVETGDITAGIVLVNNASETAWFQTLTSVMSAICGPKGRVKFWSPEQDSAAPLQGQTFLYAGHESQRFARVFAPFGFVALMWRPPQ